LRDEKTLEEYDVKEGCTLFVVRKKKRRHRQQHPSDKITIFIRVWPEERKIPLVGLNSEETIGAVKRNQLKRITGIPPDRQRLFFGGKELQDEKSFKDYDVADDFLIQVAAGRERGG